MKKILFLLIMGLFLMGVNAVADDVSIDSNGNVETGVSASGNLQVIGASGEDGIVGSTSGTGAAGVYGTNTTSGNYGILGYDNYGVYGSSASGYAGYFDGNTRVTGDLTVDGLITGFTETDPTVNLLGKATLSCASGQVVKWSGTDWLCADDIDTNTSYLAGTGLTLDGTTFHVNVPLSLSGAAAGGIISGINSDANGAGVYGHATNSGYVANLGGSFTADGGMGVGVQGYASGSNGTGVNGIALGSNGIGVYGHALDTSGASNYGGMFIAEGDNGRGIYGSALNGGIGGYFSSVGGYGLIVENGDVGIGTTVPSGALEVARDQVTPIIRLTGYRADAGSPVFFMGRRARGTMASPSAVQADDILASLAGTGYGTNGWPSNPATRGRMDITAAENWTDSAQGAYMSFRTTSTGSMDSLERMRITDEGNVGIGTTSPAGGLEVVREGHSIIRATSYNASSPTGVAVFSGRRARGTKDSPLPVLADDFLAVFAGSGYGTSGFPSFPPQTYRGRMIVMAAEDWTDTAQGTHLTFRTTPTGSITDAEWMRITSEGNVGIGTPDPAERLSVAGTIESTFGGIKFPDGTIQTTASTGSGGGDGHSLDAADGSPVDVVYVDNFGNVGISGSTTIGGSSVAALSWNTMDGGGLAGKLARDSVKGWLELYDNDGTVTSVKMDGRSTYNSWILGNLGVGTNIPLDKLEVSGAIRVSSGGLASIRILPDTGYNEIWTDKDLIISSQGGIKKVGIGTATPGEKLEVNGYVKASGYKSGSGSTGLTQAINLKGSDGNNCTLTVESGLITGTTCP